MVAFLQKKVDNCESFMGGYTGKEQHIKWFSILIVFAKTIAYQYISNIIIKLIKSIERKAV